MGTFGEGLKAFNWITERITQISNWLKARTRRKDVQTMDDAIDDGDDKIINKKLTELEEKVKNREDSK